MENKSYKITIEDLLNNSILEMKLSTDEDIIEIMENFCKKIQNPLVGYKGFWFEDAYEDIWRINHKQDKTGYAWIANKSAYPTMESCLTIMENDEEFQLYLKMQNGDY